MWDRCILLPISRWQIGQRLACAGRIVRSSTAPAHRYQSNSARVRTRVQGEAMLRSRIEKPSVGTLMPV